MTNLRKAAAAVIAGMTLSTGFLVAAGGPAAAAPACTSPGWWVGDGRVIAWPGGSLVRTAPSANCSAVGMIQPGEPVRLDCFLTGEAGTWSHVTVVRTGMGGWARDSLLPGNGANVHC